MEAFETENELIETDIVEMKMFGVSESAFQRGRLLGCSFDTQLVYFCSKLYYTENFDINFHHSITVHYKTFSRCGIDIY